MKDTNLNLVESPHGLLIMRLSEVETFNAIEACIAERLGKEVIAEGR